MRVCGTGDHDGECQFTRRREADSPRRMRRLCACGLTPHEAHRAFRTRVNAEAGERAEVAAAEARVTAAGDAAEAAAFEAEKEGVGAAADRIEEARQVAETEARGREEQGTRDRMERGGRTRGGSTASVCPGCGEPVHHGGVEIDGIRWHKAHTPPQPPQQANE